MYITATSHSREITMSLSVSIANSILMKFAKVSAFQFISFISNLKNAAISEIILFCWSPKFIERNKTLVSHLYTSKYRFWNTTNYARSTGKLHQFSVKILILKNIGESISILKKISVH